MDTVTNKEKIERAEQIRAQFKEKAQTQLEALVDTPAEKGWDYWEALKDDLETSLYIVRRFDNKIRMLQEDES